MKLLALNRPITPLDLPVPRTLTIVLLPSDVTRRTVLRMFDPGSLFVGHPPVGLYLVLHLVDPILPMVQSGGFPLIQLPAGTTLVDPPLLVRLPLVNPRRLTPFGIDHTGHHQHHRAYSGKPLLHRGLLDVWPLHSLPLSTRRRGSG